MFPNRTLILEKNLENKGGKPLPSGAGKQDIGEENCPALSKIRKIVQDMRIMDWSMVKTPDYEKTSPIIFLDVDGVLHPHPSV